MAETLKCSIGIAKDEDCHKLTYTQEVGLVPFGNLNERNMRLVELRSEINDGITTICYHHKQTLLIKYETYQRACCDPFALHKRLCKGK